MPRWGKSHSSTCPGMSTSRFGVDVIDHGAFESFEVANFIKQQEEVALKVFPLYSVCFAGADQFQLLPESTGRLP